MELYCIYNFGSLVLVSSLLANKPRRSILYRYMCSTDANVNIIITSIFIDVCLCSLFAFCLFVWRLFLQFLCSFWHLTSKCNIGY